MAVSLFQIFFLSVGLHASTDHEFSDAVFRTLNTSDGLSQSNVFCLIQDHHGFLWAGTENGLNRYDGQNFQSFLFRSDDPATLSDDWICALWPDPNGTLWVGTRMGIDRFDPITETFTHFPFVSGPREGWCLARDGQGRLWYGTDDGLFFLDIEAGKVRSFPLAPLLAGAWQREWNVRAILPHGNSLWIGTWGGGLVELTSLGQARHIPVPAHQNRIRALAPDRTGQIWLGTASGAVAFSPTERTFAETHLPDLEIPAVFEDRDGSIWFGTRGAGLFVLQPDGGRLHPFTHGPHTKTRKGSIVWSITQDRTGVMWFGFGSGQGIGHWIEPLFHLERADLTEPTGLNEPCIWSIYRDPADRLWLGTESGLSMKPSEKAGWRHYTAAEHLPESRIWTIEPGSDGMLWLGTNEVGLLRFDSDREISVPIALHRDAATQSKPAKSVPCLAHDRDGRLWIGTKTSGLFRIEDSRSQPRWLQGKLDRGRLDLTQTEIFALCPDPKGGMWVGTHGEGLLHWEEDRGRFTQWFGNDDHGHHVRKDRIWTLHLDSRDRLWLGFKSGGLAYKERDSSGFFRYTTANSQLPDNTIYTIEEDRQGFLWLSTNRGLSRLDPTNDTWLNFSPEHGLQSHEFNLGASFAARDGRLYFAGIDGFNTFMPSALSLEEDRAPLKILELQVARQGRWVLPRTNGSIPLAPNIAELRLSFARLDFVSTDSTAMAYKLEGVDRSWIETQGNMGQARYTFLPSGSYTFRVRSADSLGRWSDREVAIQLDIPPPLIERAWFRSVLAAGVLTILWLAMWLYGEQQRKTRAWIQEALEKERFTLEENLHDGPLQSVKELLLRLDSAKTTDPQFVEPRWVRRGLSDIREGIQQACFALLPPSLRMFSLASAIQEWVESQNGQEPELWFKCHGSDEALPEDLKIGLFSVFRKGIQNAILHAAASTVTVNLTITKTRVTLRIQDDGVGFESLSRPGERARNKHFGLICAEERVRSMKGRLQIHSKLGQGTTFKVQVPLPRARSFAFVPKSWIPTAAEKEFRP
ncbi:hypothetical protein J3U87_08595 [Sulfidibacter corallicola]|uniref:Histidine kinase domain-containing protein n=1 Tax=Sulfidibacter corallicola TaxID=2818388 RepID=A0A8A4TT07_SULCO|nr:hypothetical protein J3U87_08595 [Sulfidibacter corallicola]